MGSLSPLSGSEFMLLPSVPIAQPDSVSIVAPPAAPDSLGQSLCQGLFAAQIQLSFRKAGKAVFKGKVLFPIHLHCRIFLRPWLWHAWTSVPKSYEQSHLPALGLTPAFLHLPEVPGEAGHSTPGAAGQAGVLGASKARGSWEQSCFSSLF